MTTHRQDLIERLHRAVDQLPASEVATALRVLEALRALGDPLAGAPEDNEPTTDADRAAIAASRAEYREGKGALWPRP